MVVDYEMNKLEALFYVQPYYQDPLDLILVPLFSHNCTVTTFIILSLTPCYPTLLPFFPYTEIT
jgi:hypothetical protein